MDKGVPNIPCLPPDLLLVLHGDAMPGLVRLAAHGEVEPGQGQGEPEQAGGGARHPGEVHHGLVQLLLGVLAESFSYAITR